MKIPAFQWSHCQNLNRTREVIVPASRTHRRRRPWVTPLALVGVIIGAAVADSRPAHSDDAQDPYPIHDTEIRINGGLGYKTNPMLSNPNGRGAGLWRTQLEADWLYLKDAATSSFVYLSLEDTRYLEDVGVDSEQLFIALARGRRQWGDHWAAGAQARAFFQDQVYDVSVTEDVLTTLQVEGHRLGASPFVEFRFEPKRTLKLELSTERQYYASPLDDYWEWGPTLTYQRPLGELSDLRLSYGYRSRSYDERARRDGRGIPMAEDTLSFGRHEWDLRWRRHWTSDRRWSTSFRLGLHRTADNGGGYFDYWRVFIGPELRYRRDSMEWSLQGRFSRYDYAVQGLPSNPAETRHQTNLTLALRGRRHLTDHWSLFGEYQWDASRSNGTDVEYRAQTIVLGLGYEF